MLGQGTKPAIPSNSQAMAQLHSAISELRQWSHPKTDPVSRSHPPKNITSTHIQKPNLSWLVKNCLCELVKSGRGDCLLKGADINVRKQGFEVILSVLTMVCACVLSFVWLFATPWTIYSLPGSSVQGDYPSKHWNELLFPPSGIFLTWGSNPSLAAPSLAGKFFNTESPHLRSLFTVAWNWNSMTGRKLDGS